MIPLLLLLAASVPASASAGELDAAGLQQALTGIVSGFDSRIGACAQTSRQTACIHAEDRFSLQSVMKLVIGVAVRDAVDAGRLRVDEKVTIRTSDLSVYVQPLAKLVSQSGYRTTIGDLVRRAIIH